MRPSELRRTAAQSERLTGYRSRALRLRARLAPQGPGRRVFVNSIPKAGTHLVMAALDSFSAVRYSGLHLRPKTILRSPSDVPEASSDLDWELVRTLLDRGAKKGQYVTAHLWGHPELFDILEELGYGSLFVVRDPRDIVISSAAYIASLRRHPHHRRLVEEYPSDSEKFLAIIDGFLPARGEPGRLSLEKRLEGFSPWLSAPGVLCCRFEDLVGDSGGGSSPSQVGVITDIGSQIGQPVTAEEAQTIARSAWSPKAATFRAGVIGEWRERFDQTTRDAFEKRVDGKLLRAYGYEP
jgi:hypothetical protein